MRQILPLMVLIALLFTPMARAASPQAGKDARKIGNHPGRPHDGPPGHRRGPPDIVLFGLTLKGEETKPFLLSIPPLPPSQILPGDEKNPTGKNAPPGGKVPPRPDPHGFLAIDGQGHVLGKIQASFLEKEEGRRRFPPLKSVQATILDLAPPAIDPDQMREKREEERQEIGRQFEESLEAAKGIGTLQITFSLRQDLKSPIMTDIEILTGEGTATVNGEEFKLLFVAPPPPPRPEPGEGPHDGPRGQGDEPPAPPLREGK